MSCKPQGRWALFVSMTNYREGGRTVSGGGEVGDTPVPPKSLSAEHT